MNTDIASKTGQKPTLPNELIDHVLGFMDSLSLKAASLASHSLLNEARRHLFQRIVATDRLYSRSIVDLQESIADSPWALHSQWIRCLHVIGKVPFATLISILSTLSNLLTLELEWAQIIEIPDPLPPLPISTRTMKAVHLYEISYGASDERTTLFAEMEFYLLHLFSSISELHLIASSALRDETPWRVQTPCPPKVKVTSLELVWSTLDNAATARAHVAMLQQLLDVTSLTAFKMLTWPPSVAVGYSPIYLAAYQTLSDLGLIVALPFLGRDNDPDGSQFWSQLGLSSCHALRTLRFVLLVFDHQLPTNGWRCVIDILSTIFPSSLSKITFSGSPAYYTPLSTSTDFPWESLESTLIERCRDAAQVLFDSGRWDDPNDKAQFAHAVLQKLPRVNKKCVMQFEDFDSPFMGV